MSSHNPFIRQLDSLDHSSPQFYDQLTTLLREENYPSNLSGEDTQLVVDYLDKVRIKFPCF